MPCRVGSVCVSVCVGGVGVCGPPNCEADALLTRAVTTVAGVLLWSM